MQSQVAERDYRCETSNAEPVRGNGGVSLDAFAGFSGAFELSQGFARGGVRASTGFDKLEAFLTRTLELVPVDSSSLNSGWARSRPSNELSILENEGEAKLGVELIDCGPVGAKDSKWVSDLDPFFAVADSWLNEEKPDANGKESDDVQQDWQALPVASEGNRADGNQSYESGSDNCVSSNAGANDLHSAYYPSETNGSHLKCEETK
jgi:hypothetical protein